MMSQKAFCWEHTIENSHNCNLNDAVHPTLDIFRGFFDVLLAVVPRATTVSLHFLGPSSHDRLLLFIQEVGSLVVLGHDENAAPSPDNSDEAFNYVEP